MSPTGVVTNTVTSDPTKDSYNSDNFSSTDKAGITSDAVGKSGYKGYLGTPSGKIKEFDPAAPLAEQVKEI